MTGLTDKTVVVSGPFGLLLQNLTIKLTEFGADVALVTDDVKSAQRVCQNIMDMREVSEKFGRAAAIEGRYEGDKFAEDNFSRSAELFGTTDIYLDTHLYSLKLPFFTNADLGDPTAAYQAAFRRIQGMSHVAAKFLKGRSRGRILFMLNELDMWSADKAQKPIFNEFREFVQKLARDLSTQQTAVNALALGVNEEYLLSRFAKTMSIQNALLELKKTLPHARIVDYNDVSTFTSFLISPASSGLSGQVLRLNHGL